MQGEKSRPGFKAGAQGSPPSRRASTALLITIDGPAGAGKTSVSKRLASRLGYRYVDTGALYRAVAHEAIRSGIAPHDDTKLRRLCAGLQMEIKETRNSLRLMINDRDITDSIRTPEIAMAASTASAQPSVRDHLLSVQRSLGDGGRCVFEGRDMGTVVFPKADIKFFLDADPDERAKRRFGEMKHPQGVTLEQMKGDILKRDEADSTRKLAPLAAAPDAIYIDSSRMSEEEVVQCMLDHIKRFCG